MPPRVLAGVPGRTVADLKVALVGLAFLLAWEFAGLDLPLTRLYGDLSGFYSRDHILERDVIHDGGRWLAGALLALLAANVSWPLRRGPSRGERAAWFAVVCASMLVVPWMKRFSTTSCPWDLAEFGGHAAYVPHWMLWVVDHGPGHCFPSGHAVSAFAFIGAYFLWREHDHSLALWLLALTVALGVFYGWAQLARGAHFASHTLWSAWICWTLAAVAESGFRLRQRSLLGASG
jgi:membrane-associated PAP2 superfamily phosphatase